MHIHRIKKLQTQRILIVGPNWIGDMVLAQSLFIQLKKTMPQAAIDVIGPSWSAPILTRMSEVSRIFILDNVHGQFGWRKRWVLARQLRNQYSHAFVLPRSFKSALIPFLARIGNRIGFTGEYRYGLLTERRYLAKTILDQTVKRFVSLAWPVAKAYPPPHIDWPRLIVDYDNQARWLTKLELTDEPLIALLPGAEYGPAKRWPIEYFRRLAIGLVKQGYTVLVLGSIKEREFGADIAANFNQLIDLTGKTDLVDVVDLLAACQQVVSNDSGLMHIAAAINVPLHAIYGSSSPHYTPPLTPLAQIHCLHLSCSPCFQRQCPLSHLHCLRWIMPDSILQAIAQVKLTSSSE